MLGAVMPVMVKIWPAAMFSLPRKYVLLHHPLIMANSSLIQQIEFFCLCSFRVSTDYLIIVFCKQSLFPYDDELYAQILILL